MELPHLCHSKPQFTSLAFRAKSVMRLLQELDSHEGVDSQRMFPLLFQRNADVLAPGLSRGYRALVRSGSFSVAGEMLISLQFLKDHRQVI